MWKTFSADRVGNLEIATKLWSDFAATIPLIRSFSLGTNFPPQYPIFAGPPIRYHFLFFLVVGLLEKAGIPLTWALNTLSALSFTFLTILIYLFAKTIFRKRSVGLLSCILFLFNGSLSFVEFFKKHPLTLNTPFDIATNINFPSFGPYDEKIVSAFWNLNIFTNQRHLAFAYASFLLLILLFYRFSQKPGKLTWTVSFLIGVGVGAFPFIHMAVFGMMAIALVVLFLIYPKIRWKIFATGAVAVVLALPQVLYMGRSSVQTPFFSPGYLTASQTLFSFVKYWFFNLGVTLPLVPIGFILAKREQRKIFIPFLALFIVGSLFRFSPEIAANHKFFNLFAIGANMFVAFFLVSLWQRKLFSKLVVLFLFPFLILSGIIDFFPIVNDSSMKVVDVPANNTAFFIQKNTPKDAVFLNASFLYDPASLAGRKIYLGWPYFAWSAGYDTQTRHKTMQTLFSPTDKRSSCESLKKEKIDFVEIQIPSYLEGVSVDFSFFQNNFVRIYYDRVGNFYIYDVKLSCQNIISYE